MKTPTHQQQNLQNWLSSGSINIFGRPFSGKDTQAKNLAKYFNCSVIGGGDIIRKANKKNINKQIESGLLAPQADYLSLVLPYFNQAQYQNKPLILSSLGRWYGEQTAIMKSAILANHPIKAVIYLDIAESAVYDRYQIAKKLNDRGHRKDDSLNSIDTRLQEFNTKTLPVIEFYEKQNLLITVNGALPVRQVSNHIIQMLLKKSKNNLQRNK